MFINRDNIQDFMKKCVEHLVNKVANDNTRIRMIKAKCYLQVKVRMEYYHDKPDEPLFKTTKVPFYFVKIIDRSNLILSLDDLRKVAETQVLGILRMMDNFEHNGSDWVLLRPIDFKFRLIRYKNGFKRARGFIPTPAWLNGRRAIINIQNKDENCFFKCIYRYFNRDKHRNDHRHVPIDGVNNFFTSKNIDKSLFRNGITCEALRAFEQ
jgi:hypothetical protein